MAGHNTAWSVFGYRLSVTDNRRPTTENALRVALWLVVALFAQPLAGQAGSRALTEAGELERRGRLADAAARYRDVLRSDPVNVSALLGLERVLEPLRQLDSLVPSIRVALGRDSLNRSVRALELRVWASLGKMDSVVIAARRWVAAQPGDAEPWREWAFALAQHGDLAGARRVLSEGSNRLSNASLAQELAQLTTLGGEWSEATRQWLVVVRGNNSLLTTAAGNLSRAPPVARDAVLGALVGATADTLSRLLAADLLAGWGRAGEGWSLLDGSLPAERGRASALLQRFVERTRSVRSRDGALVRAYALERLAGLSTGPPAERARVQAAQAYAEAGDLAAAERLLDGLVAGARGAGNTVVGEAVASLIAAMAQEGLVKEAEARLEQWEDRLPADVRAALSESIAWGWMRKGELDRAEQVLHADSTVGATAVRGWIALYRGYVGAARELLRAAGPYTGTRDAATQRTAMLVLLERVERDTIVELGRALHALAAGDSARALEGLERLADRLPPRGGRAEVLGLAGGIALGRRDFTAAERLLLAAISADSTGPVAATAEYGLADTYVQTGRTDLAMQQLEHLIVSHSESAEVPHARRLLDRLRGAVPEA